MLAREEKKTKLTKAFAKPWLFLGLCVALIQGCSFFSTKTETSNDAGNGAFKATVSPSSNPIPIPIEVATEISQIASGKATRLPPTIMTPEKEIPARDLASGTGTDIEEIATTEKKSVLVKNHKSHPNKGKKSSYKVRHGDTLMKISFEKYGNVYRWREIYDINKNSIRNFNILVPGTLLTIAGAEYVVIEKNGKPYLIKRADTLVKISKWLYGSSQEWKNLWSNNRQLIHDPNKIYAGFTLYYQPKEKQ
jgi:nucleoid-associated protein YgaU